MKTLFIIDVDIKSQCWAPVRRLTRENGLYRFVYTRGAEEMPGFHPFGRMQDLHKAYLMQDLQNPYDNMALLMRTVDPITLVGYAPRYYSAEFTQLIKTNGPEKVKVTVEQVNNDAPEQYRVLCKLLSPWPANFSPVRKRSLKHLLRHLLIWQ